MPVASVRYRPEQARWLAELIFDGNRELEDAARASGTFRPELRVSDADVVRVALDRLRTEGGWKQLRDELLEEARRVKPGPTCQEPDERLSTVNAITVCASGGLGGRSG